MTPADAPPTTPPGGVLRSHWITLDEPGAGSKEEAFFDYDAVWRGEPVRLTMAADRYTYADGRWSNWRIVARDAVYVDDDGQRDYSRTPTDTARSRLGAEHRTLVSAWLDSPAYAASRSRTIGEMLRREVRELRPYATDIARMRARIAKFDIELTRPVCAALMRALDAFASFTAAYDALDIELTGPEVAMHR